MVSTTLEQVANWAFYYTWSLGVFLTVFGQYKNAFHLDDGILITQYFLPL